MKYIALSQNYPNWHYIGSKRSTLPWIFEKLDKIDYEIVLDLYGGSGVMTHGFLSQGKRVWYNDLMTSNRNMVQALLTRDQRISSKDLAMLSQENEYHKAVASYFTSYFTPEECYLLDQMLSNLHDIKDDKLRYCLLYILSQAAILKQGKGTFLENTMNRRIRDDDQSSTWHRSFMDLMNEVRTDLNQYLVDKPDYTDRFIGATDFPDTDILNYEPELLQEVDLIYADPPFASTTGNHFGNYIHNYHLVEFFNTYPFVDKVNRKWDTKLKKFQENDYRLVANRRWLQPEFVKDSIEKLINLSMEKVLVLSYRDDSYLTGSKLDKILNNAFSRVEKFERPHKYDNKNKPASYSDLLYICA